jgi:hypothetical protein
MGRYTVTASWTEGTLRREETDIVSLTNGVDAYPSQSAFEADLARSVAVAHCSTLYTRLRCDSWALVAE